MAVHRAEADGLQPELGTYALLSDRRGAALVSRAGSIDWCCLPRFDAPSVFARVLDAEAGGHCRVGLPAEVAARARTTRRYVAGLVLETRLAADDGAEARVVDALLLPDEDGGDGAGALLRVVEGVRGETPLALEVRPRFDTGRTVPWVEPERRDGPARSWRAVGGGQALRIRSDLPLEALARRELVGRASVRAGERRRLLLEAVPPHGPAPPGRAWDALEDDLERTTRRWRRWGARTEPGGFDPDGVRRSAAVVSGLTYAPTGGIVAAATTSLPEVVGGASNWDYRFVWVRDAGFVARSLARIGHEAEARALVAFLSRATARGRNEPQVLYDLWGGRAVPEHELGWLGGWRGSRPVRHGNAAERQLQLDVYGELLDVVARVEDRLDERWSELDVLLDRVARRWSEPDHGLWEDRGEPKHHVHSKAMCWLALERGIRAWREAGRAAPARWRRARDDVRAAILARGVDEEDGTFTARLDERGVDAALLQLPRIGFVDARDPRMVRTTDAIVERLSHGGLLLRNLDDEASPFLACSFWLVECLVRQGRAEQARATYARATEAANDLGLLPEMYDPDARRALGNTAIGLSHYSRIGAALALGEVASRPREAAEASRRA